MPIPFSTVLHPTRQPIPFLQPLIEPNPPAEILFVALKKGMFIILSHSKPLSPMYDMFVDDNVHHLPAACSNSFPPICVTFEYEITSDYVQSRAGAHSPHASLPPVTFLGSIQDESPRRPAATSGVSTSTTAAPLDSCCWVLESP